MTIGTSIFLVAVGAILRFAIADTIEGVDVHLIGLILMIVGAAGVLLSLLWDALTGNRNFHRHDY